MRTIFPVYLKKDKTLFLEFYNKKEIWDQLINVRTILKIGGIYNLLREIISCVLRFLASQKRFQLGFYLKKDFLILFLCPWFQSLMMKYSILIDT